jgi:phage tail sheath gpL-like
MAITGYPSNWRGPFSAAEILLGQGPSNASGPGRDAVYYGPITASGAWTVNKEYEVKSEQEAVLGAGPGSFLHRMVRKHLKINPRKKLFVVPYAASSGGGVASATSTVTWTMSAGLNPTALGATRVFVCGELCNYSYGLSDTVSTIATGIAATVNAKTHLPVTAGASLGVVTLTAKHAGASSGDAGHKPIHVRVEVDPSTNVVVASSGHLGSVIAGADGATTEAANLTAALAANQAKRHYYKGFSVWSSADTAVVETHARAVSSPSPGLRCRTFQGYTGTLGATSTIAIARNYERCHVFWQKGSDHDTAELAAWLLASTSLGEETDAAFPGFDNYTNSELLPAADIADWPTETDVNDAITDGICVATSNQFGANLSMHVTTRSKDSTGLIDDFRATETHRISVMDSHVDKVLQQYAITYQAVGFKLMADPLLPNGRIDRNKVLPPKTITPDRFLTWYKKRIQEEADEGQFQDADGWKAAATCEIDKYNSSRLVLRASGRTIDLLHQFEMAISETSPG